MEYTTLGRTGLRVSVAGLGCGGFSRLGLGTGKTAEEAQGIVRQAFDLGVTLFDTAAAYNTEEVLGKALSGVPRDAVVVATKASAQAPERVIASLDESLRRLGLDHVDIFQLHGVAPSAYDHARDVLAPALLREKEKGKIRFLGLTETSPNDHGHDTVRRAVADGLWDTVMIGFHMMHQNARELAFPQTAAARVGTLLMFAVRNIFSKPERLASTVRELVAAGKLPEAFADGADPLAFLVHDGVASSVTDAAYRFVRHEPGVDVVLFGTGDPGHLRTNIESILKPPLPEAGHRRLVELFGHLVGIGLDPPGYPPR